MRMRTPQASAYRMVVVTASSAGEAEAIGRTLVDEQLAACVNIAGPIRSIYRWEGKVEQADEQLLLIKTTAALYRKLERRIRALHSYQVPEVLALAPRQGSAPYLAWMSEATTPQRGNRRAVRTARKTGRQG
jgi:periplasmic divalent cation tolerance protein